MNLPLMGKDAVGAIVPHKRSMLLLDGLTTFDREGRSATSFSLVERSNIFFDEGLGGVPGYICFELMAQSISAYDYLAGDRDGGKPKVGFILGVNKMRMDRPVISLGSRIETAIIQDCAIGDSMFSFLGESRVDGKVVASANLMVFSVLDPHMFLR